MGVVIKWRELLLFTEVKSAHLIVQSGSKQLENNLGLKEQIFVILNYHMLKLPVTNRRK